KKVQPVASAGAALDLHTHQLFVDSLLQKRNRAEVRTWLATDKRKKPRVRLGDFKSKQKAVELVQRLYAAGAVSVTAADLYWNDTGDFFCDRLVVELPKAKSERDAV